MTNILAGQETPGGLILYDAFVTAIKHLYIPSLSDEDIRFIAENYLVVATS